jgi:phosphate transport system substrate-binding protein
VTFIGREAYQPEIDAFKQWFGYEPLGLKITSGSYATQHKTFALMVYVNKDNPLSQLTLPQLDAIYGMERRAGAPAPIHTWGQLGLTGAWADRPIHVVGYNFDTGMAGFFRRVVLKQSERWNPDMQVLDNGRRPDGEVINAGTYILDAVAKDPDAIGFANLLFENPSVKQVALAAENGSPYVTASPESAWRRDYPLTRYSTVYVNRRPGQPLDPKVAEFLRYILSREGVEAVIKDKAFLPLHPKVVSEELQKLE